MKKIKGKVWKFREDINTDEIIPARYLNTTDIAVLASHCMDGIKPGFSKEISAGDIIVAGKNYGCGSSREHAPVCIKAAGISCVIAASFARIFYRNSFNIGLPIFEIAEAGEINEGDQLEVNPDQGEIKNLTKNNTYKVIPIPEFMQELINCGGLMAYAKKILSAK